MKMYQLCILISLGDASCYSDSSRIGLSLQLEHLLGPAEAVPKVAFPQLVQLLLVMGNATPSDHWECFLALIGRV